MWNLITLGMDGKADAKLRALLHEKNVNFDSYDDLVIAMTDDPVIKALIDEQARRRKVCLGAWIFFLAFVFTKVFLM